VEALYEIMGSEQPQYTGRKVTKQ